MTTEEAAQKIEKAGGNWLVFCEWMGGQTVGGTPTKPDWYEYDVERFIRYKCNPKNEPTSDFD